MTPTQTRANGLGTPRLPQLWLTVVLRLFVELVHHVASMLQMIRRRDAVIGTQPMPTDLPRAATDTQPKDLNTAAQHRCSLIALILSSTRSVRPSKDEGVLTTVSHTPSVSLGLRQAIHFPQSPCGGGNQRIVATKGVRATLTTTSAFRLPNVGVSSRRAKTSAFT